MVVLIGLIENRSKCLAAALLEEIGGQEHNFLIHCFHLSPTVGPPKERTPEKRELTELV